MNTYEPSESGVSPDELAERAEMSEALRRTLDRLSLHERHIVALRFGADLSHEDIAETLSVPRATVSERIRHVLSRLRVDLARAGLAGVSAQLTPTAIGECICSGHPVPPDLAERVLAVATRADPIRVAVRGSLRGLPRGIVPGLAGAAILLTVGATTWRATLKEDAGRSIAGKDGSASARKGRETTLPDGHPFGPGSPTGR
jgi:hypothetical protein